MHREKRIKKDFDKKRKTSRGQWEKIYVKGEQEKRKKDRHKGRI